MHVVERRSVVGRLGTLGALLLLIPAALAAQETAEADKTLSPYFFVHSDDPKADALPLKSTDVDVRIAGVIADVKVTQHYRNEGKSPIEAEYVFPGSTRAAVYGLTMTIGERRVVAQIREKQQARAEYTEARAQGKSAALLEQQRPNVFTMNVANILPGDEIAVELSYTELLVPTDRLYEFVFPTVVGPRYTTRTEAETAPHARWQQNPYLRQGEEPTSELGIRVTLNSGIALKEVSSPSHLVLVAYNGEKNASVELASAERRGGNRDFVLDYRLAGDAVEAGVLLYDDGNEKYFLATIEPPRRVTPAQIPPREYIFILDVSGSMHGFPLDVAKALMRDLASHLRPTDTFNILLFSGGSALLAEASQPATPENVARATGWVDAQRGGGGTELLPALRRALALPGAEDRSRSIVVVTDGYVDVEAEAFELIRTNLDKANLFAFGIGNAVNRYLIEGMARAGLGEPFVVTNSLEAPAHAAQFRRYIEAPVLTRARLTASGTQIHDLEPRSIPDVLAERPVVVLGKWDGRPRGTLKLTGIGGDGPYEQEFDLSRLKGDPNNAALRYLWARSRIARLSDDQKTSNSDERKREITSLGLEYSLLTAYTSFIAIDQVVRNSAPGDTQHVKQPLPLPQGVSNLAVGGEVPTSPEPELLVLLAITGAIAEWHRRRRKNARAA